MLIPSYCSGAMVMITSLSRRVNANFECWNAWVDLADLAVMAAAGEWPLRGWRQRLRRGLRH